MLAADVPTLRQLALQMRVQAAEATERGEFKEAEAFERRGDDFYAQASALGDTGVQLPWVRPDQTPQGLHCLQCRKRFQSVRADAQFCSSRCRQRHARLRKTGSVTDNGLEGPFEGAREASERRKAA